MEFPTDYKSIIERLENIDAEKYAATRNFIDGAVTYLSPYISRGVISLPQVKKQIVENHKPYRVQKLLQELTWREYWQRVWQAVDDKIFTDLKQEQTNTAHRKMVAAIENADTGIKVIDESIELLHGTGYMHNHLRMYIASITCNIGKAHWLQPSKWMYYHLLDGDLASNSLSWQWVAGTFSSKKYYCNQENINKFCDSNQHNTFLDFSYEDLTTLDMPRVLEEKSNFFPKVELPDANTLLLKEDLPVLVYNSYNLDPIWHLGKNINRILLLEPSHFKKYPISPKVLQFIIDLSKNIRGIQLFVGEFEELEQLAKGKDIIFKYHPAFTHYRGTAAQYDTLFPQVTGYFNSFSAYWKKCEKYLR
jgi:deoxyribodipyrimidine photo-lyase